LKLVVRQCECAPRDLSVTTRKFIPLRFSLNLGYALIIRRQSDLFLARTGRVWLINNQFVSFVDCLIYVGRYFNAIAPLVLRSRQTN
jgi:hypothetical protein